MTAATTGLITFSPTGTTRRIAVQIAQGLGLSGTTLLDLTLPDWRAPGVQAAVCDVAVIGSPVYAGRLPPLLVDMCSTLPVSLSLNG